MVVDLKKPYSTRVVLWAGRRRKCIRRSLVDELGTKFTVAAEPEVIKMLLQLGDVVCGGRDGSIAGVIVVLGEPVALGAAVEGLRTNKLIQIVV